MRFPTSISTSAAARRIGITTTACACLVAAGCNNAGEGAVSGAAIGALSGLAIGSLSGDAGKGAAIGAIAGGVGGAVIGDQNRRNAENSTSSTSPSAGPAEQGLTDADLDRLALRGLEGAWTWSGWSELVSGDRRSLSGTAVGSVHQSYYLMIDLSGRPEAGTGDSVTGTLTFASEPARGLTLEARTSNAPVPARFTGSTSPDRRAFTLVEDGASVAGVLRRMNLRFLSDSEWVIDVQNIAAPGSPTIGSFTFTRTR